MRRMFLAAAYTAYLAVAALGYYEWTAKSPFILGSPMPGWRASDAAEKATRWQRPTGLLVVDKALHEGEEALRFYGLLR